MPQYTFLCENCQAQFNISCYISDYDATTKGLKCPKCESVDVCRDYQTDKISGGVVHQTLGMLAQKNSDRMSDEEKARINYEHNKYKFEEGNELPQGMKRIRKPVQNKYLPPPESPIRKKRQLNIKKRRK